MTRLPHLSVSTPEGLLWLQLASLPLLGLPPAGQSEKAGMSPHILIMPVPLASAAAKPAQSSDASVHLRALNRPFRFLQLRTP